MSAGWRGCELAEIVELHPYPHAGGRRKLGIGKDRFVGFAGRGAVAAGTMNVTSQLRDTVVKRRRVDCAELGQRAFVVPGVELQASEPEPCDRDQLGNEACSTTHRRCRSAVSGALVRTAARAAIREASEA